MPPRCPRCSQSLQNGAQDASKSTLGDPKCSKIEPWHLRELQKMRARDSVHAQWRQQNARKTAKQSDRPDYTTNRHPKNNPQNGALEASDAPGMNQRDRRSKRQTDRQTDRRTDTQTAPKTNRQTDAESDRQTARQTDRRTDKQTRQTNKHIGRQTDKQTNR